MFNLFSYLIFKSSEKRKSFKIYVKSYQFCKPSLLLPWPKLSFLTCSCFSACLLADQSLFYSRNREGNGIPLQYSCLENPMDGGAWQAAVHGVAKRRTRLSDFTFTFHFHSSEKEMATHSSVLAQRVPGKGEPGGLPSIGTHRVRHD